MQVRRVLIVSSLLASLPVLAACSPAGGGDGAGLYYPPPVNYNPRAGLLPMLNEPFDTSVPSSPPFRP